MNGIQVVLVVLAALGCGLIAGALYAFSSFVMAALRRLPPEQGIAAMQSINTMAVKPAFMTGFFGTGLVCVAVVIWAVADWNAPISIWLLVGAGLYLLGVVVLTAVYHVPRNTSLASISPNAGNAADVWSRYLSEWTRWNHLRVIFGLLAAAALIIAIRLG